MKKESQENAVHSLGDLEMYGLNCLTGEACSFGMRLLFDVSKTGQDNLELFLGCEGLQLAHNWNSAVGDETATGSIMLTADTAWEFAAYMLLLNKYDIVIPCQPGHHGVYGFNTENDIGREYLESIGDSLRVYRNVVVHDGTGRNQHQFTGRYS